MKPLVIEKNYINNLIKLKYFVTLDRWWLVYIEMILSSILLFLKQHNGATNQKSYH